MYYVDICIDISDCRDFISKSKMVSIFFKVFNMIESYHNNFLAQD